MRHAFLLGLLLPIAIGCSSAKGDASVDSETGADADADADSDIDATTQADADTYPDTPTESDTDSDTDIEADSDTERDMETCDEVRGVGEPLAEFNECGTLSYGLYANQGQDEAVHRLPDFSFAGYRGGGVAIPHVPVAVTVDPGDGDDRRRIQEAIDAVSALEPGPDGHRGAVLLSAGTYQVSDTLLIETGGVVLRGEGQDSDGTVLIATRAEQHNLIEVRGGGSGLGEESGTRRDITTSLVPVGSRSFEVSDGYSFSVGDVVGVLRTPNQAWLEDLGMDQWGWTTSGYTIGHERLITGIDGNTITVDIPLVDTIEDQYGGGALFIADLSSRIQEVGIEDLRLVSEHDGAQDEEHGWKGISLQRVENCWVHGVTTVRFGYSTVSVERVSRSVTVEECAFLDPVSRITGGRRYSFNLSNSTGILFQRCYSEESRHDFVSHAHTPGPNVFLDCYSRASHTDDGPHHRWATGLLFDNLVSFELHVENREDSGTGHGWSGAQTLFWNSIAEEIICDAPRGAMNWTIGCMGEQAEGRWAPEEAFGWWESHGRPVEPRSLYLQQLQDRLGADMVRAVTTSAQREGRIWGQIAAWAGEGNLEDFPSTTAGDPTCSTGVSSGISCCAVSCGTCGGEGCGSRPGGADVCCEGRITVSGRSCQTHGPPCILDPDFEPIGDGS